MKMKNGKSCGPEGIYAELLKSGTSKLYRILTRIINECLNGHETPRAWRMAYISSIFKKGDKSNCQNYRGISVTSTISRLYGRILRGGDRTIYSLQFADDQAVIAGDKEDLEYMTRKLKETSSEWGLTMNMQKTKYLKFGDGIENLHIDVTEEIEVCNEYKYLGVKYLIKVVQTIKK